MSRWQPISTAPRDETHILAARFEEGHSRLPVAICWNPWVGRWCRNAGPDAASTAVIHEPTHWMPIEPPPEAP